MSFRRRPHCCSGPCCSSKLPLGAFSNASLNGGMVVYFTGGRGCTGGGLITADGIGGLTLTLDQGCIWGGSANDNSGTYVVAPDGRIDIRYLTNYTSAY